MGANPWAANRLLDRTVEKSVCRRQTETSNWGNDVKRAAYEYLS